MKHLGIYTVEVMRKNAANQSENELRILEAKLQSTDVTVRLTKNEFQP